MLGYIASLSTLTVVPEKYLSVDRALHKKTVALLWGQHPTHLSEQIEDKI